jgi:hypothetical protein
VSVSLAPISGHVELEGPGKPGAEVVATLRLDLDTPVLVGRALDEKGRVLRHAVLRGQLRCSFEGGDSGLAGIWGRTDGEGRFRVRLPKACAGYSVDDSELTLDGAGVAAHLKTPLLLANGALPVGDLVFRLEPLIVAGRIVCKDPPPVEGLLPGFRPMLFVETVGAGRRSAGLTNVIWLEDGKFEVRGNLQVAGDAELRLVASGFGDHVAVPFVSGQKNVDVTLEVQLPRR